MSVFPLVKAKTAGSFLIVWFVDFGQRIKTMSALKGRFFNLNFVTDQLILCSIVVALFYFVHSIKKRPRRAL